MTTRTTFELIAARQFGDPEVGTLLARLNPEIMFPKLGQDLRMPSRKDLLEFRRTLGGEGMPAGDQLRDVLRDYWTARRPRAT